MYLSVSDETVYRQWEDEFRLFLYRSSYYFILLQIYWSTELNIPVFGVEL